MKVKSHSIPEFYLCKRLGFLTYKNIIKGNNKIEE